MGVSLVENKKLWCISPMAFIAVISVIFLFQLAGGNALAADNNPAAGSGPRAIEAQPPLPDPKIDGEIETLRNGLKEKPSDSAFIRLGRLLLGKGALNDALQAFDEALRLNPRSFEAKIGKGVVLGRQGELEKAEQLLRNALVLNPNPVRVHYELALLYEKRGEFGKAIAEYKEGLIKYQEGKR